MDDNSRKVLTFIQQYKLIHSCAPTFAEIGDATHLSLKTVYRCVDRLKDEGYISREPGKVRAIQVLKAV